MSAKILEKKYQAVRFCSDELRSLIPRIIKEASTFAVSEELLRDYLPYFMQHYDHPNRLIILDASIDRRYIALFPFLELKNIPYLVIRVVAPRELVIARLEQREGDKSQNFLKHLSKWYADYETFGKSCPTCFILENSSDNPDFSPLFSLLDQLIQGSVIEDT